MHSPFDVGHVGSEGQVKRFIERGRSVAQSTGRINVRRIRTNHHTWWASFWADPFHSVIHHSTIKIMAFFCASYLFTHLLFSLVYYMVDESCDLQIKSLLDAMYLSLEVGMTIGWGLPGSPYMKQRGARHGCFSGVGIVYLHTLTMSMQNALMIGLIYCRMSRGTSRAASLVFSEKAVIREIGGKFYFMFQVCESKKHQLVEAKVRCYALCTGLAGDQSPSGAVAVANFENRRLRLVQPDDAVGSFLHLALPNLIIHEIDQWSPLCPEAKRATFPGPFAFNPDHNASSSSTCNGWSLTKYQIEEHLSQNRVEVVSLIEGMEPITSACTQGRMSYSYVLEDVLFDCAFAPCVLRDPAGTLTVDFNRFQELIPAPAAQSMYEILPGGCGG